MGRYPALRDGAVSYFGRANGGRGCRGVCFASPCRHWWRSWRVDPTLARVHLPMRVGRLHGRQALPGGKGAHRRNRSRDRGPHLQRCPCELPRPRIGSTTRVNRESARGVPILLFSSPRVGRAARSDDWKAAHLPAMPVCIARACSPATYRPRWLDDAYWMR